MLVNRNLNPPTFGRAHFGILGLSFRNLRTAFDYLGIAGLRTTCQYEDGVERMVTAQEIAGEVECPPAGYLPRRNVILAELAGRLLGYVAVSRRRENNGNLVLSLSGCVHPGWRRRGIGGTLLKLAEKRAAELAGKHPLGGPVKLLSVAYDEEHSRRALLEQRGYQADGHRLELLRDLSQPIPHDGQNAPIEIRPGCPEDRQHICQGELTDLMHEPEVGARRGEDYLTVLNQPQRDLRLWGVAWYGDQVAGWAINLIRADENDLYNRARGYTENLCVRERWLGGGLTSSLLVFSLLALRKQDMAEAVLEADASDHAGRRQIYSSLGYQTRQTMTIYSKSLSLPALAGDSEAVMEA
jgi:mycothiol synthase